MSDDDDATSVHLQPLLPHLEYGEEYIAQAAPWPQLFSPETDRAVRVLCWTGIILLWLGAALAILALIALVVGFYGTGQPPPVP